MISKITRGTGSFRKAAGCCIVAFFICFPPGLSAQEVEYKFDPPDGTRALITASGRTFSLKDSVLTGSSFEAQYESETRLKIKKRDSVITKSYSNISSEIYTMGERDFAREATYMLSEPSGYIFSSDGTIDSVFGTDELQASLDHLGSMPAKHTANKYGDVHYDVGQFLSDWNHIIGAIIEKNPEIGEQWFVTPIGVNEHVCVSMDIKGYINEVDGCDPQERLSLEHYYEINFDEMMDIYEDFFFELLRFEENDREHFSLEDYGTHGWVRFVFDPSTMLLYEQEDKKTVRFKIRYLDYPFEFRLTEENNIKVDYEEE